MATSTYHADDTGCSAWDGESASTMVQNGESELTAGEKSDIATSDNTRHFHNEGPAGSEPVLRLRLEIAEDEADVTQLRVIAEGYGRTQTGISSSDYGFYVHIWNLGTQSWDYLGGHGSSGDSTVDETASGDLTDYIDGNDRVFVRVKGPSADSFSNSSTLYTDVVELEVTYSTVSYVDASVTWAGAAEATAQPQTLRNVAVTWAAASEATAQPETLKGAAVTWAGVSEAVALGSTDPFAQVTWAGTAEATAEPATIRNAAVTWAGASEATAEPETLLGARVNWIGEAETSGQNVSKLGAAVTWAGVSEAVALGSTDPFAQVTWAGTAEATAEPATIRNAAVTWAAAAECTAQPRVTTDAAVTWAGVAEATAEAESLVALSLGVPASGMRRLSWSKSGTVYVVADGEIIAESDVGYTDLESDREIRGVLLAYAAVPGQLPTPRDEVLLTVSGDAGALHEIDRRPSGGSWAEIAATLNDTYTDGPLDDGTYDYRVADREAAGRPASGYSSTRSVTVSSVPDPPSGITYSYAAGTVTIAWTASPSADVAGYRGRKGWGSLDLYADPDYDDAATSWDISLAGETGMLIVSVHAVDSDGNEEQNISQVLAIPIESGAVPDDPAQPGEPRIVAAEAVEDGKIELHVLYDPADEDPADSGAAHEARIYWDAGTGTVDYSSPTDTVALSNPTAAAWYTWTSGSLTDGQEYTFVVRIATAAHPAGIETSNTDEHSATADDSAPSTPTLTAEVV